MFEKVESQKDNVLIIKASGKLYDRDYQDLTRWMEDVIAKHERIRMLFLLEDFHGFGEMLALWDDAKLGVKHYAAFERVAVVGDQRWEEWIAKTAGLLMFKGEIKYFDMSEKNKAQEWVYS